MAYVTCQKQRYRSCNAAGTAVVKMYAELMLSALPVHCLAVLSPSSTAALAFRL
jgi:hypothetical protein